MMQDNQVAIPFVTISGAQDMGECSKISLSSLIIFSLFPPLLIGDLFNKKNILSSIWYVI